MNVIPVEYKVLVEPDKVDSMTKGGIFLPETSIDKQEMAREQGTIVAASEMAFSDWTGRKPRVGDKVIFSKYGGSVVQQNGKKLRLLNDKDIGAIIEENEHE